MATLNLEDIPFECLVHIGAYVDTHTVVYSLSCVSRLLNAVASDPVLWTKAVVTPCCDDELVWLASKFPTIRYIDYSTTQDADFCRQVISCCPGLVAWSGLCRTVPDHGLQLVEVRPAIRPNDPFSLPESCYSSLRSVILRVTNDSYVAELAKRCPQLTQLMCGGFFETHPSAFPALVTFDSIGYVAETAAWSEFVESHPMLTSLSLWNCRARVDATEASMPRSLTSFNFSTELPVVSALACAVVVANPGLKCVSWMGPFDDSSVRALTSCHGLRVLDVIDPIQTELSAALLEEFAADLSLHKLHLRGGSRLPEDSYTILAGALGDVVEPPQWLANRESLLCTVAPRMANVTSLHLHTYLSVETLALLSSSVQRLRTLEFMHVDEYTVEHFAAFSGVARGLHKLKIFRCTPDAGPLIAAAASSPRLAELTLYMRYCCIAEVTSVFLGEWDTRPLKALCLGGMSVSGCRWLLRRVRSGELSAISNRILPQSSSEDDFFVEPPEFEVLRKELRSCGRPPRVLGEEGGGLESWYQPVLEWISG